LKSTIDMCYDMPKKKITKKFRDFFKSSPSISGTILKSLEEKALKSQKMVSNAFY